MRTAALVLLALLALSLAAPVYAASTPGKTTTPSAPQKPGYPGYPYTPSITAYVENFDPATGIVTVSLFGASGVYRVEVISGGRVVYSRTVAIPGAVAVRLEKQQLGNMVQLTGLLRVLDPESGRQLYAYSIYIAFYAPKPEVYVRRAVLRGGTVYLTLQVVTGVRTDVTVYVDGKPVVSRTVTYPTEINVSVKAGGLRSIDISMQTDFGSYEKSFQLLVPVAQSSGGSATGSPRPSITALSVAGGTVVMQYSAPETGEARLYVDGKLVAAKPVEGGKGTVTFVAPQLGSGRHTVVVELESGGRTVRMTRVVGSSQQSQTGSRELGLAIGIAVVIGVIVAAASRRGGLFRRI